MEEHSFQAWSTLRISQQAYRGLGRACRRSYALLLTLAYTVEILASGTKRIAWLFNQAECFTKSHERLAIGLIAAYKALAISIAFSA